MLRNKIGPSFDSKKCFFFSFLLVFLNKSHSPCRKKRIFEKQKKEKTEKTWTKFWLKKRLFLGQVLTLQHIYIYAVESKLGPQMAFFESKLGPIVLCFLCFYFQKYFLSAGRMRFSQKKRKLPFFWVKTWSNFVAQHTWTKFWLNLGPSFDSTFLAVWGHFSFYKRCWNHYFYSGFSKNELFKPTPPKLRKTICEHNCANWFFYCPFFLLFAFCFFAVSGFGGSFFGRNENTKETIIKTITKKEARPQDANKKTT